MDKGNQRVEIWGDIVEIRSLAMSILFSGFTTMGAYFLAPSSDKTRQLFFGLAGSVFGFIISTIKIKPKREILLEETKEKNQP